MTGPIERRKSNSSVRTSPRVTIPSMEKKQSQVKLDNLSRFGFSFERGGAHTARTMMLRELQILLEQVSGPAAAREDYIYAIQEQNCLRKRSGKTRVLTCRHLLDLYSLDPAVTLFKALLYFWNRDPEGQPLLALLCAYSRDPLLRTTAPLILSLDEGTPVMRTMLEESIEHTFPGRFKKTTLTSTAQNINATWTYSGHVRGKVVKVRSRATATPGAVAYALLLGFLNGSRGESLFGTEYAKLLDCSVERQIDLAGEASRKGWIVFKRVGKVMEAVFPSLLSKDEMEWIREQN